VGQQVAEGRAGEASAEGEVAVAGIALERLLAGHVTALAGGNHFLHSTQFEIPRDVVFFLGQRAANVGGIRFLRALVTGRFVRRLNRFAALVEVQGREERVHVRNSGRLRELFTPGRPVLLDPAATRGRRTRFTLALVRLPAGYVSADAHLPNALVAEGLGRQAIPGFRGHRILRREPAMGSNRADFLLVRGGRECLLEVKSVTLVEGGMALFPDAPTVRGRIHLEQLIAARRRDLQAAILFVIQRSDATGFAPNREADPEFSRTLRKAAVAGVRIIAMTCRVDPRGVRLAGPVPVCLNHRQPGLWHRRKGLTPSRTAD
jgi:sugar fermentation stimulation protein A